MPFLLCNLVALLAAGSLEAAPPAAALAGERYRVLVSSDIGGTDPDDFQSMVHLLLYADLFDIEGIISSPYGPGRLEHIHQVIDAYAKDYAHLRTYSAKYPSPEQLHAVSKQGAADGYGPAGFGAATDGSEWIIRCARRADARPLYVLVWGGIDDLAQALHDAPDIAPKLRVYFIGGPNKMWSANAYDYIEQNHPKLWFIEANSTYRGWFTGGNQAGEWGNSAFANAHLAGRGALGEFFMRQLKGTIKMGDSPAVGYLLRGTPDDPSKPSWGGAFVRVWDGRKTFFSRHTSEADQVEVFGIVEYALPLPAGMTNRHTVSALFDNRVAVQVANDGRTLRFRFSPRDAKVWQYRLSSDFAALDGISGKFTAVPPPVERTGRKSQVHPNWWIDAPDPAVAEGVHAGAKTVSQWRVDFLRDFAARASLQRPRVVVLTDIENEPDDAESLVRFLVYSNQWDVEALVATTSIHQKNQVAAWKIREIVNTYGKVRGNLLLHEPGFPETDHLLARIKEGRPAFGMAAVGENNDSPGSEAILEAAGRDDRRPLWVLVWGGPNCLAQALWKARKTRTPAEVARLIGKLRVYTISDQDDSGPWIRKTFPGLFYIASPGVHSGGAYHEATWSGISGDRFHGRFSGADFGIVDNPWLEKNIRSKGPLGAQYPAVKFLMEGDTPTFLYLIDNGLGSPEHPDWGSWGGRYEIYTPRLRKWFLEPETRPFWTDAEDEVLGVDGAWHQSNKATIWRWRAAYQNDFAARMDWTIRPYAEANHPPLAKLAHAAELRVRAGERVMLSAKGSTDPDGHELTYNWFYYGEASSLPLASARSGAPLRIEDADREEAWFAAPANVTRAETMHIVLAVTDKGSPPLTRYRRVIVTVLPR